MRILYLNNFNYPRGGAENVLLNEAISMEKEGHYVYTFSRKHPDNIPSELSKYYPSEMETESVKLNRQVFKDVPKIFYNIEAKKGLRKALEGIKIDVAHAHNIYGGLTTSVLDLLKNKGIPTIMTLHDYKLICPNYKLMHHSKICEDCKGHKYFMAIKNQCHKNSLIASSIYSLETYYNHLASKYKNSIKKFVSPSKFLKEKFIEFGWMSSQIEYIPNFIDISGYTPDYNPGKYFLYIGRLSEEKGISTLIDAFSEISDKNAKLYVVGDGPIKKDLQIQTQYDKRIIFTGYLVGEKLAKITRNALSVIVPSEWYENAPLSILEAFSFGKPVVGSNIGGIPEIINDGHNGYHFKAGDVNSLHEKLELFLRLPDIRIKEMGIAARFKVEKEFNAELHYKKMMQIYMDLL